MSSLLRLTRKSVRTFQYILFKFFICRLSLSHAVAASMVGHWLQSPWVVTMKLLVAFGPYYLGNLKLILEMLLPLKNYLKVCKKVVPVKVMNLSCQSNGGQIHTSNCKHSCWSSLFFTIMVSEKGDQIAGFLFEPIQGEAGVCVFFNQCDHLEIFSVYDHI